VDKIITLSGDDGDLIATILEASLAQTQHVTNRVIEHLQDDLLSTRATLAAVRDTIAAAFEGPYMPTPEHVLRLLWPVREVSDQYRKESVYTPTDGLDVVW
jgi:hypothetical protein